MTAIRDLVQFLNDYTDMIVEKDGFSSVSVKLRECAAALTAQRAAGVEAADCVAVPRTTLEWIKAKTADKRNPAVAFVCDKLLRGETFDVLREGDNG